jgi:CBS domain-containing protein
MGPRKEHDMGKVADILREKGPQVFTVEASSTVFDAIKKMTEHNVGALLTTSGENQRIAGIVTERDYLRRVILRGRSSRMTEVREIMTDKVICVSPSFDVEECMAIMTDRRIRHLPVFSDRELVGLVSIGDLVRFQASERKFQVNYLTDYITGKYPG